MMAAAEESKMSDVPSEEKSTPTDGGAPVEEPAQPVVIDKTEVGKPDGEPADPAVSSKENNDDIISQEEEDKLLAADDDDDLDVIDCYTEDFDSDMENDFCRKEATKAKERERKAKVQDDKPRYEAEEKEVPTDEKKVEDKTSPEKEPNEEVEKKPEETIPEEPAVSPEEEKSPERITPDDDDDEDDEDVIRIDDDLSDMFLESSTTAVTVPAPVPDVPNKPEISPGVKNEREKQRILSEPLVKQMIIPEVCVSDDEEDDKASLGSQESLSLHIDHVVEKAAEIIQEKQTADRKASPAGKLEHTLNNSGETGEARIYGCQQEDPDVLRLKLDLYQEMGEMDYEQDDKTDEDGEKNTSVRVKQEPSSPVRQRPVCLPTEDIPTIELTSTDEEAEPPVSQVQAEAAKPKKKKRIRKRSAKKKASPQKVELKPVSSNDSFPIVAESTVSERSIESRIRNDSEGSFDGGDVCERVKSLRNRNVSIVPEIMAISIATRRSSRASRKSIDKEPKEPARKKKRIDPAMQGYSRRKSVGRSASKSSVMSTSTAASSIPDEGIVVISADDILLADPNAIDDGNLAIENECESKEDEAGCKSANESKEELMSSLSLKEAIVKELEGESSSLCENEPEKEEPEENSFPVPTTDLALEDMLDAWIGKEAPDNADPDALFHSISPEEKFLMDSLFADCEKQSQQLPSQEHLESLNTIMDDGKPLVERSNDEPMSVCYTIYDGSVHPEVVHVRVNPSNTSTSVPAIDLGPAPAPAPHIKIIQNYHKYPFQEKAPKKQQQTNKNATPQTKRGRRGRKRIVTMGDSDEEYRPPSSRKRSRATKKPQQAKLKATTSKTDTKPTTEKHDPRKDEEDEANDNDDKQLEDVVQQESKSDVETTSSVCMHMPTLEEDLAMTSSDDDENLASMVDGGKTSGDSKEQLTVKSPAKKGSTIRAAGTAKDEGPKKVKRTGLKHVLSTMRRRGRPKLIKPGISTNEYTIKEVKKPPENGLSKLKKRRLSRKSENSDSHCPTAGRKESTSQQSLCTLDNEDKKTAKRPAPRRKRRLLTSSSSEEEETTSISATTETEPDLQLSASPIPSETDQAAAQDNTNAATKEPDDPQSVDADQMDNLQILISPLTEKKIRLINTPQKKPKTSAKASQTEIYGLTWSVDLDQIDFHSEYFNKLRTLLNHAASRVRSFKDIDIPSRSALHQLVSSQSPPRQQPAKCAANGNNKSYADMLLFHRDVSELEHNASSNSEDPLARQRLEQVVNNVRSSFRIPKLSKKPSTSPQVVTSSTPHVVDPRGDDEFSLSPRPSTSRANDQSEHNRPAAPGAGAVQRLVVNDYVDDHVGHSNDGNDTSHDRQDLRTQMLLQQERFVPPINRNANPDPLALSRADNEPPPAGGQAVSNQVPPPGPSLALDKRSSLPNRAELFNVKRTIKNDMAQTQPVPSLQQPFISQPYVPPQQPALPSFSMLGTGFQPSFVGGSTSSYNRGLMPGYSGMNMAPSMFPGGMLGMQQPEANVNNLIAMLWEQMNRQQQMNQPTMPPSVVPMVPGQNAPSQMSGLGQMFPQMSMPSAVPQFEPQRANEHSPDVISLTFGCIDFLTNKCIKPHCRYSHGLPKEDEVYQKLSIQNRDSIMVAYKFVASRDDLFNKYFPVFARVMGEHNLRHQLVSTIPDCELPKRQIQYYKHIVYGLTLSGTNLVKAVQIVLEKHTKKSFQQINVLVDLILDTAEGIPTFLGNLEEFASVKDYRFQIGAINRLLEFCNKVEQQSNALAVFVSKLILNVPAGEEPLVNTLALIEFTKKAGQDPELAINVDYIVRKYGKVEVSQ